MLELVEFTDNIVFPLVMVEDYFSHYVIYQKHSIPFLFVFSLILQSSYVLFYVNVFLNTLYYFIIYSNFKVKYLVLNIIFVFFIFIFCPSRCRSKISVVVHLSICLLEKYQQMQIRKYALCMQNQICLPLSRDSLALSHRVMLRTFDVLIYLCVW